MTNCCDEYCWNHGCKQADDCPVRVAKYKPLMRAADPLPSPTWRAHVNRLACWVLMGTLGLIWLAFVGLCVHLGAK
jgi:hypothetical protein